MILQKHPRLRISLCFFFCTLAISYHESKASPRSCRTFLQQSRRYESMGMKKAGLELLLKHIKRCSVGRYLAKASRLSFDLGRQDQAINLMAMAIQHESDVDERKDYKEELASFRKALIRKARIRLVQERPSNFFRKGFRNIGGFRAVKIRRRLERRVCLNAFPGARAVKLRCRLSRSLDLRILFHLGKSTLRPESMALVESIVEASRPLLKAETRLLILGHTDPSGTKSFNLYLSRQRAKSVRAALIARGIPSSKILVEGMADDQPVASNKTREGRAQNRRVEFSLLKTNQRN